MESRGAPRTGPAGRLDRVRIHPAVRGSDRSRSSSVVRIAGTAFGLDRLDDEAMAKGDDQGRFA